MNWCSFASVEIFSNSVQISSLSSFSVPFSAISMLRSARCMSLLSVGVVEQVDHLIHCVHIPQALSVDQNNVALCLTGCEPKIAER